jgi:hypothetical protein
MSTITLYRYTWAFGPQEICYSVFPIDDDRRRQGQIPIDEIEVEVPDMDPDLFAAAATRGARQHQAVQKIRQMENAV